MGEMPVTETLWNRLVLAIFRLHGAVLQHGDRVTASFGLSSARWQALGSLREEARTVPQVGRQMGLSRQAVQRTMDALALHKLVVARRNPDHRTSPLFELTGAGRSLLSEVNAAQRAWLYSVADALPAEGEAEAAVRLLEGITALFEGQPFADRDVA
jgi:DNA-binding MarR family transcriptional regulator